MKFIKAFIFFILILSCSDKKDKNFTSEFDNVLGKKNIETLNFLVSDFENDFLKRQYPNLDTENAYRQFLTELRDEKTENWKRISQKARDKFKSSDLRLEMYKYPDSVWIIENSTDDKIESDSLDFIRFAVPYIKTRYKDTNLNGKTEYTFGRGFYNELTPNSNFDSIIKQELERPSVNFIGKYIRALESIKDKSEFHKEFYNLKNSAGFLTPESTAKLMLNYAIDLNDKINRIIIILEFVY